MKKKCYQLVFLLLWETSMLQTYCLVAAAAQRAAGLDVYERATTASPNNAATGQPK